MGNVFCIPFFAYNFKYACKTNEWSTNFRFYNHSLQNSALRRVVWVKWRRVVGDAKSPWKVPLVILMFSKMNVLLPFVKVNYVFPFFMLYSRKPITLEDTLNTSSDLKILEFNHEVHYRKLLCSQLLLLFLPASKCSTVVLIYFLM